LLGYVDDGSEEAEAEDYEISNSSSLDWRDHGAVTGIKDQGHCGSCWSFSVTGAIEGADKISHGKLTSRSEQHFVDCAGSSYHCHGCNGGSPSGAMDFAHDHAINTESSYPYKGKDGSCHSSSSGLKIKSHSSVKHNDPNALKSAVDKKPVSVVIEADTNYF